MFRTILVPLDGSAAGEHALPLAVSLARRAEATLRLVHVRHSNPPLGESRPPKEQDYLDMVAWKIRQATHLPVFTAVLDGPVAETIAEHSRAVNVSLIVMTTHGRGPISRMWIGSVADDLIRRAPSPVLVLRPTAEEPPPLDKPWAPKRVLVPLDGSAFAEAALPAATEIAKLTKAEMTLFRIVEPIPVLAPDGLIPQPTVLDATVLDELKTQARAYVERTAEKLRKEGLCVTGRIAIDDRTASAILEEEKEHSLTAISTHARHGVARLLLGSVADKLVRGAIGPVLIARPLAH